MKIPKPLNLDKAKMERPYWTKFWGVRRKVRPQFLQKFFGDGRRLIFLTPLMTRPHHYLIRVDSSWSMSNFDENGICDHLEEIYEALEEQFGWYSDGHSSEYDRTDGTYPGWPVFYNEGCSWGEVEPTPYLYRKPMSTKVT